MASQIVSDRNSWIRDGIPSSAAGVKGNKGTKKQGWANGGAETRIINIKLQRFRPALSAKAVAKSGVRE